MNHGPGKGDKARHKLDDQWRANYDAIDWGHNALRRFVVPIVFEKITEPLDPSGYYGH